MLAVGQYKSLTRVFDAYFAASTAPRVRSMTEFAEQEIWLPPGGPFGGQKLDLDRQPWTRHWCALLDSPQYRRLVLVKPGQVGGTLFGFNLPLMYHLFELKENVGVGIPTMDMAWDKWVNDILPMIEASQYADQIPTAGRGSKGGGFTGIKFKNGATLKFLSGSGDDKTRAGITLRALVVTEVDGLDEAGEKSREADPVTQMEARLNAFEITQVRIYLECTVSTAAGRIWKEWKKGTASTLLLPCPHCRRLVNLERKDLKGWQQAESEVAARRLAAFVCPSPECQRPWTETERRLANDAAVLVSSGQEVAPDGTVKGLPPETLTASLRVSAVHNMLRSAGDVGWKEWKALHDPDDSENNQKALVQFVWTWPWNGKSNSTGINEEIVASRLTFLDQFVVPEDADTLVVQIDMHFRWHYWTVMAGARHPNPQWKPGALLSSGKPMPRFLAPHYSVIDYGLELNPDRKAIGPEAAMMKGLELLADRLESQEYVTPGGRIVDLDLGMIDGGFRQLIAVAFVTSVGGIWQVVKGAGRSDQQDTRYHPPKERTADLFPGDHWYDSRQPACDESNNQRWWLRLAETSHWMHQLHGGLMSDPYMKTDDGKLVRRPGSVAIFGDDPEIHLRTYDAQVARSAFATQLVGWTWGEAKTKSKTKSAAQKIGWNKQWEQDHWLDTSYGAMVGDSVVRTYSRKFRPKPTNPTRVKEQVSFTTPDGRPYLLTDR